MKYSGEWERIVNRLGRWIDFKNDYKTLDPTFMESVWWVFSELNKKGYVYRGFKVMPYSTGCTTPLSNFEANLGYKDVSDPASNLKIKISLFKFLNQILSKSPFHFLWLMNLKFL